MNICNTSNVLSTTSNTEQVLNSTPQYLRSKWEWHLVPVLLSPYHTCTLAVATRLALANQVFAWVGKPSWIPAFCRTCLREQLLQQGWEACGADLHPVHSSEPRPAERSWDQPKPSQPPGNTCCCMTRFLEWLLCSIILTEADWYRLCGKSCAKHSDEQNQKQSLPSWCFYF